MITQLESERRQSQDTHCEEEAPWVRGRLCNTVFQRHEQMWEARLCRQEQTDSADQGDG